MRFLFRQLIDIANCFRNVDHDVSTVLGSRCWVATKATMRCVDGNHRRELHGWRTEEAMDLKALGLEAPGSRSHCMGYL
jgi:hypothetical protein